MIALTGFGLLVSVGYPQFNVWGANERRTAFQRYVSPKGAVAAGVGVCDLTGRSTVCWDMAGQASQSLARAVEHALIQRSKGRFGVWYGRKNRILVLRHSLAIVPRVSPLYDNMGFSVSGLDYNPSETVTAFFVSVPRSETTAALRFSYYELSPEKTATLPAVIGKSVTLDGKVYRYAGSFPVWDSSYSLASLDGYKPPQYWWYSVHDEDLMDATDVGVRFLDSAGEFLTASDAKGRVEIKSIAETESIAYYQPSDDQYGTPIQPAQVSALRLTKRSLVKVCLEGFPVK